MDKSALPKTSLRKYKDTNLFGNCNIDEIERMEVKEDDTWVLSFPRSGKINCFTIKLRVHLRPARSSITLSTRISPLLHTHDIWCLLLQTTFEYIAIKRWNCSFWASSPFITIFSPFDQYNSFSFLDWWICSSDDCKAGALWKAMTWSNGLSYLSTKGFNIHVCWSKTFLRKNSSGRLCSY